MSILPKLKSFGIRYFMRTYLKNMLKAKSRGQQACLLRAARNTQPLQEAISHG